MNINPVNGSIKNNLNSISKFERKDEKDWTVFLYINTEDEGSVKNLMLNLKMLEMVGSDKNLNIVVQAYIPSWGKVKRFYIEQKEKWETSKLIKMILSSLIPWKKFKLENKPVEELEKVNLNDPKVFEDSLKWVIKNYPSKKLMVMTIGDNEGLKTSSAQVSIKDFAKSIENVYSETKVKPDILVMDGSSVASIETVTELKDKAKYLVGTSGFAPKLNVPFAMFLNEMKNLIDGGPNDVESVIKSYFLIHNLSGASHQTTVVNLSNESIDEAVEAWDQMAKELLKLDDQDLTDKILPLIYKAEDLANTPERKPYLEMRDAISFAKLISQSGDLPQSLRKAAHEAVQKVTNIIYMENNLYKKELDPDSNGISVFMPDNFGNFKSEKFPIPKGFKKDYGYSELLFSKLTNWDEFLNRISQKGIMEKFLLKLGFSQSVIDNIYAMKNHSVKLYKDKISGWASLMAWFNAVNRISSDKPVGLWFIPPFITLPLGIVSSIEQIYDNIKTAKYVYDNIPQKDTLGLIGLDAAQGLAKLIANVSYLVPFLAPAAPVAGLFTFLLPWIKDFYNVYLNYKNNKEKFVYNDVTFTDTAKMYFLNKFANMLT
ncbi:MAG: clostripain-related cysteine peptidase [Candidatus Calescibacterium sp.]|nr:clostripain-related cysteine peptidase [Candidatus Calescibacterium sp.]MDW8132078.1 clostripain-related cysteine peptidase [Candidatus Calescibacterium sp.]